MADAEKDRLPQPNDVLKGESGRKYRLETMIGEGGYGSVFKAVDETSNRVVALKAEKWSKTVLNIEVGVLKMTTREKCKHFCAFLDCGKEAQEFMFIVMTFLGPDLAKLRNECIGRKFTMSTALRVGIQTLEAIQELHRMGFLSRDVKPGNFAVGNKDEELHRRIFMFDFGLSKKYIDKNCNLLPARKEPGWRGTTRYGSLQAHLRQDLSRRDDVESWFYALVELTKGSLPWRLVTDRAKIFEYKINARNDGRKEFLSSCPKTYDEILTIIDKLIFESSPPYEQIIKMLEDCCKEIGVSMADKYDWEFDTAGSLHTSLNLPSIDKSPADQGRAEGKPSRREL